MDRLWANLHCLLSAGVEQKCLELKEIQPCGFKTKTNKIMELQENTLDLAKNRRLILLSRLKHMYLVTQLFPTWQSKQYLTCRVIVNNSISLHWKTSVFQLANMQYFNATELPVISNVSLCSSCSRSNITWICMFLLSLILTKRQRLYFWMLLLECPKALL